MPKTIRNKYYENLTYEKLMKAHMDSKKGKGRRKEIILFNLKQEEYIKYLLEKLQTKEYKHGGYAIFYVTEPKVRKIEKSKYIDRIVHRWLVDNILKPYYVPRFIETSYACIEKRAARPLFFVCAGKMAFSTVELPGDRRISRHRPSCSSISRISSKNFRCLGEMPFVLVQCLSVNAAFAP